jgi:hypothetical protein
VLDIIMIIMSFVIFVFVFIINFLLGGGDGDDGGGCYHDHRHHEPFSKPEEAPAGHGGVGKAGAA